MKLATLFLVAASVTYTLAAPKPAAVPNAVAAPNPAANPNTLIPRAGCRRKLQFRTDRYGTCVQTSGSGNPCQGGDMYKADCDGAGMMCCIKDVFPSCDHP